MDNQMESVERPNPQDFVNYLPYACCLFLVEPPIRIVRVAQTEYKSIERTGKSRSAKKGVAKPPLPSEPVFGIPEKKVVNEEDFMKIYVTYDSFDNIVHIKFNKTRQIPRKLIKLIGLVIPFQPFLTGITINSGLNLQVIYELSKFLHTTNITEVCFDDTFVKEGNHYILLEKRNQIKHLSLARCKLNDNVVLKIVSTLVYPKPSSKTLCLLNLSTNIITDVGAKHISNMLRVNRQLFHLNLAGNRLTDEGAGAILDMLKDFYLDTDEILTVKRKMVQFLKEKNELVNNILVGLRSAAEVDKREKIKKTAKAMLAPWPSPTSTNTSTLKKGKVYDKLSPTLSVTEVNLLMQRAEALAKNELGEFFDPYDPNHTFTKDGIMYCCGNNVLCYLNLSYNHLSYISLKKLLNVLETQRKYNKKPKEQKKGLIRVNILGNNLPNECQELKEIDYFLGFGQFENDRRLAVGDRSHKMQLPLK